MNTLHNLFDSLKEFDLGQGRKGRYYSLPALEKAGVGAISKLPVSIRLVLESVLRNCDGKKVSETNVRELAQWQPKAPRTQEIPFIVARIVLQDFTGVPLLVDLAAMRSAVVKLGKNPKIIEPLVPVDLVVDHSVQVDFAGNGGFAGAQSGHGISTQPRALPVSQVGHAGIRHVQSRAARHWHRASGQFGISGQGRSLASRGHGAGLLSRHTRRDRFAYHHDQRPWHCRLGRGRHRGGGRHAGAAGLFSDAGRGWCAFDRRRSRKA